MWPLKVFSRTEVPPPLMVPRSSRPGPWPEEILPITVISNSVSMPPLKLSAYRSKAEPAGMAISSRPLMASRL